MDLREQKRALRARFRADREALSPAEAGLKSAAICERVAGLPELRAAETVHVYWPIERRREVDTRPLIRRLEQAGRRVVLPVVVGGGRQAGDAPLLRHVAFAGEAAMRPNRWGLLEPEGPSIDPRSLDAVVVPAFGAGRDGHRVGHGHGYYDAFLAGLAAFTVGVVYAACLVPSLPAEPHDVPLDAVVTEEETVRVVT